MNSPSIWLGLEAEDEQHSDIPRAVLCGDRKGILLKIYFTHGIGQMFSHSLIFRILDYSPWRTLQLVCLSYELFFLSLIQYYRSVFKKETTISCHILLRKKKKEDLLRCESSQICWSKFTVLSSVPC